MSGFGLLGLSGLLGLFGWVGLFGLFGFVLRRFFRLVLVLWLGL